MAPGNTIESFEAALEHGVDMVEFDILRTRDGRLVLAHDYEDAGARTPLTIDEGLDHFAGEAYAGVELDVDLKLPGYEREVVEGLAERGLAERSLVSSMYPESLDRVGELGPGCAAAGRSRGCAATTRGRGWRCPPTRRCACCGRACRASGGAHQAGGCEAIMSHCLLVSAGLVDAVHDAGGEVYVWTVDDAGRSRPSSDRGRRRDHQRPAPVVN